MPSLRRLPFIAVFGSVVLAGSITGCDETYPAEPTDSALVVRSVSGEQARLESIARLEEHIAWLRSHASTRHQSYIDSSIKLLQQHLEANRKSSVQGSDSRPMLWDGIEWEVGYPYSVAWTYKKTAEAAGALRAGEQAMLGNSVSVTYAGMQYPTVTDSSPQPTDRWSTVVEIKDGPPCYPGIEMKVASSHSASTTDGGRLNAVSGHTAKCL